MSFVPTLKSRILADSLNLSCFTRGADMAAVTEMLDITTICDTAYTFMPGAESATASVEMLLDVNAAAGGQWATLHGWKGATAKPFTVAPSGLARGSEAQMVAAIQSSLGLGSQFSGVVGAQLGLQIDGAIDYGVMLEDVTEIDDDTEGTSTDNGAATTNGGVAHLHVTAYTGLDDAVVTIEHSTNNSIWATLGTFATVTGLTSERLVIAPGTTVNRYLRIADDVTGTGSLSRAVAFARR